MATYNILLSIFYDVFILLLPLYRYSTIVIYFTISNTNGARREVPGGHDFPVCLVNINY